jgi:hypothetical protein
MQRALFPPKSAVLKFKESRACSSTFNGPEPYETMHFRLLAFKTQFQRQKELWVGNIGPPSVNCLAAQS